MFTTFIKKDHFETYILENTATQTRIEVVPERGAIISQYVHKGNDILYLDRETLNDASKNIRGGNPILFPISSYLENETYYYEGEAYQLKQHGFARQLAAEVIHVEAKEDEATISLKIIHNEQTYLRFPFHFSLVMTYTLTNEGLHINASVVNEDHKEMPFYLGYHPYFYVEDKEQLSLTIPRANVHNMIDHSVIDGQFNFKQSESNAMYDTLEQQSYAMIDHARQLKVTISCDEVYQYMVLWALEGKSFVCIEPWMAPVNGMNVGLGIQRLQAKQKHSSNVYINPELI